MKSGPGKGGPRRDRAYWEPSRAGFGRIEATIEEIAPAGDGAGDTPTAVVTSRPRKLFGKGSRPALSAAIGGSILLTVVVVASWPSSHAGPSQPPSPSPTTTADPPALAADVSAVSGPTDATGLDGSPTPVPAWTLWPDGYRRSLDPGTTSPGPTPTSPPIVFPTETPSPQPSYPLVTSKAWPTRIDLTQFNVILQSGVTMGPDGTTYVAGHPAIDASGKTRSGWLKLPDGSYGRPVLFAPDGTIYVEADRPATTDATGQLTGDLYAFDSSGRRKAGWPVDVGGFAEFALQPSGNVVVLSSRIDDPADRITVLTPGGKVAASWAVPPRGAGYFCGWLVAPDGSLFFGFSSSSAACSISSYSATGKTLSALNPREWSSMSISPQGRVVAVGYDMESYSSSIVARTRVAILGSDGLPTAGCPITFEGAASKPAFGPDGTMYFTRAGLGTAASTLVAYGQDCRQKAGWELAFPSGYGPFVTGTFPTPQPPVVTGSAVLALAVDASRMGYVLGFDTSGQAIPGWPYKLPQPLAQFEAGGFTVGQPNINPGLLLPKNPGDSVVAAYLALDGELVAIAVDGHAASGWPVAMPGDAASPDNCEALLATPDGGVLLVTLNPRTSVATILRLTAAGTIPH